VRGPHRIATANRGRTGLSVLQTVDFTLWPHLGQSGGTGGRLTRTKVRPLGDASERALRIALDIRVGGPDESATPKVKSNRG
jgi:hypothetical protein